MLAWAANAGYWNLDSPVTFDGELRTITVNPGVTVLDIRSLWSRWVDWAGLAGSSCYTLAMRVSGFDVIPGGRTGAVFFLRNGWRLILDLRLVQVTGVLYSDDFPTAYYDANLTPQYPAVVSSVVNTVTNTQNVAAVGPTKEEIAAQVRTGLLVELLHVLSIPNNPLLSVDSRLNYLDAPVSAGGTGGGITPEQYDALVGEIRSRSSLTLSQISAAASTGNAVVTEILTADVQTNMPLTGA